MLDRMLILVFLLHLSSCTQSGNSIADAPTAENPAVALWSATDILTVLHIVRLYEAGDSSEARALASAHVNSKFQFMESFDEYEAEDLRFIRMRDKAVCRVLEQIENGQEEFALDATMAYVEKSSADRGECKLQGAIDNEAGKDF